MTHKVLYSTLTFIVFSFIQFAGLETFADLAVATRAEPKVDQILINKSTHELSLIKNGHIISTYWVSLGPNPQGPKQFEGDGRTPEGHYKIIEKIDDSDFYKALLVSYPNEKDRIFAKSQNREPGGRIMIHGLKNGYGWVGYLHLLYNWTQGCVAVTDGQIDEIWDLVEVGTPVTIK